MGEGHGWARSAVGVAATAEAVEEVVSVGLVAALREAEGQEAAGRNEG